MSKKFFLRFFFFCICLSKKIVSMFRLLMMLLLVCFRFVVVFFLLFDVLLHIRLQLNPSHTHKQTNKHHLFIENCFQGFKSNFCFTLICFIFLVFKQSHFAYYKFDSLFQTISFYRFLSIFLSLFHFRKSDKLTIRR